MGYSLFNIFLVAYMFGRLDWGENFYTSALLAFVIALISFTAYCWGRYSMDESWKEKMLEERNIKDTQ